MRERGLVLDRWWWSTMAYGWYGGGVRSSGVDEATFRSLVAAIWAPIRADLVCLFDQPHTADANNSPAVRGGYLTLASAETSTTLSVPGDLSVEEVHDAIWSEFQKRALLA